MQTRSKIKRKAAKQVEISVLEPYHAVKAVKIEIEAIKIKGQIEETFLRFPHIGEQIFERLDNQSLFNCQTVSKPWRDFIIENKTLPIELLRKCTLIPKARLKKSLRKHDLKIVQNLANFATYKCKNMPAKNVSLRVGQTKLLYQSLFQRQPENIQYVLIELILQNVMHTKVTKITDKGFNEFHQNIIESRKFHRFWNPWLVFWGSEDKDEALNSWPIILLVSVWNGHLPTCKFITENVKDIHKASASWVEILIATANKNGYKGISILLKKSFQIKK